MTEKEYKKLIKDTLHKVVIYYLDYGDVIPDFRDYWDNEKKDFKDEQEFILEKTLTKEIEKMVDKLRGNVI